MRATVGAMSTFAVGSGSSKPDLKSGPLAISEMRTSVGGLSPSPRDDWRRPYRGRAHQCRIQLALDHRLDEFAHPIAHPSFDWIELVVE